MLQSYKEIFEKSNLHLTPQHLAFFEKHDVLGGVIDGRVVLSTIKTLEIIDDKFDGVIVNSILRSDYDGDMLNIQTDTGITHVIFSGWENLYGEKDDIPWGKTPLIVLSSAEYREFLHVLQEVYCLSDDDDIRLGFPHDVEGCGYRYADRLYRMMYDKPAIDSNLVNADRWKAALSREKKWPKPVLAAISSVQVARLLLENEILFKEYDNGTKKSYWGLYPRLILTDFLCPEITSYTEAKRYASGDAFDAPDSFICWRVSLDPSVVVELPYAAYRQLREPNLKSFNMSFEDKKNEYKVFLSHWRQRFPDVWASYTGIFGIIQQEKDGLQNYLRIPEEYDIDRDQMSLKSKYGEIARILLDYCERAVVEKVDRTNEASFLVPLTVAKNMGLLRHTSTDEVKLKFKPFCTVFAVEISRLHLRFCPEKAHRVNASLFYDKLGKTASLTLKDNTKRRKQLKEFAEDVREKLLEAINK